MLRLFNERDEISVVDDQYGTPTYAPDLAVAILAILHCNSDAYGIYHFTNEGKITWYDFAREIHRICNLTQNPKLKTQNIRSILSKDYPTKAKRPQNSYLSKEKIKKEFNIDVRPWQNGLNDFLKREI